MNETTITIGIATALWGVIAFFLKGKLKNIDCNTKNIYSIRENFIKKDDYDKMIEKNESTHIRIYKKIDDIKGE